MGGGIVKIGKLSLFEGSIFSYGKWLLMAKPVILPNAHGEPNITLIYLFRSPWIDVDVRGLWETTAPDVPPHTHGVELNRLCLLGGYDEEREDGSYRFIRPGTLNRLRLHDGHRVLSLKRVPTWTIGWAARWKGLNKPSFLTSEGPVPIAEWVEARLGDSVLADGFRQVQK